MLNPCSAQRWAEALGIDRSELLRDADRWAATPLDEGERALRETADRGPAEHTSGMRSSSVGTP